MKNKKRHKQAEGKKEAPVHLPFLSPEDDGRYRGACVWGALRGDGKDTITSRLALVTRVPDQLGLGGEGVLPILKI